MIKQKHDKALKKSH